MKGEILENPEYVEVLEFEKFDHLGWRVWMAKNWSLSIYSSIFYILLIYLGRMWMENRPAYKLRKPLVLWNISLVILSVVMFVRAYPELFHVLKHEGVYASYCSIEHRSITSQFWYLIFTFSKILEFGDTFFIVLRKQPLVFLHWYHHTTVATYTFFIYDKYDPAARYFGVINSGVHVLMYSYYACKALQINLPKKLAMSITVMQISQMALGIMINASSYLSKVRGVECDRSYSSIYFGFGMYVSYFVLFLLYFKKIYFNKKEQSRKAM